MKTRLALLTVLTLAVGAMISGPVQAGNDTKVDLIHDCGPTSGQGPCNGNRDMAGPVRGFVNYNQNGQGDLLIVNAIKKADPNTTLDFRLYCGPTHNTAGNNPWFEMAAVTTNNVGNGNTGAVHVPAEALVVCGPGTHTGHVDLDTPGLGFGGTTMAGTPIVFTVP